ncbi:hypothetical protein T05_9325 [Trichinella murrelli]|uniref:Uncharacterized protein n=1 Tax=Trichinella murrelli TaxID=144512 RepID=A0A0V0SW14_9BILA|nr:hypothetical protein T05_9325 [Trichinella murrelli]
MTIPHCNPAFCVLINGKTNYCSSTAVDEIRVNMMIVNHFVFLNLHFHDNSAL